MARYLQKAVLALLTSVGGLLLAWQDLRAQEEPKKPTQTNNDFKRKLRMLSRRCSHGSNRTDYGFPGSRMLSFRRIRPFPPRIAGKTA